MRLIAGAPLPTSEDFLPAPDDVVRPSSGEAPGQENVGAMRADDRLSGSPARPERAPNGAPLSAREKAWLQDQVRRAEIDKENQERSESDAALFDDETDTSR